MPMLLIEGAYRIVGAAPDGDSIRFYPRNPAQWGLVPGQNKVRSNKSGGAQLRLDGVDALETHYTPQGGHLGTVRQPRDFGDAAAGGLLDFLGFSHVKRNPDESVTSAQPAETKGYILTKFADVYGRPVAFAFKGDHPAHSGSMVRLEVSDLKKSANYHALSKGLAYPTYYSQLFPDLRREMTAAVKAARESHHGLWAKDVSETGLTVNALADVAARGYIMPKLYRRLMDYYALGDGDPALDGFSDYLAQRDDRLYIISDAHKTGFDFVVHVKGQTLKLNHQPEDLIFDEK